jgi:hypothetical protein
MAAGQGVAWNHHRPNHSGEFDDGDAIRGFSPAIEPRQMPQFDPYRSLTESESDHSNLDKLSLKAVSGQPGGPSFLGVGYCGQSGWCDAEISLHQTDQPVEHYMRKHSPAPTGAGPTPQPAAEVLDLAESSGHSLWKFISAQPAKHLVAIAGAMIAGVGIVFSAGWSLSSFILSQEHAIRTSHLSEELAETKAEVRGATETIAILKEDKRSAAAELEEARQLVNDLRAQVADQGQKLVAARGCAEIRRDSHALFARVNEINRQLNSVSKKGPDADLLNAELDTLEVKYDLLKGQLDACAAR